MSEDRFGYMVGKFGAPKHAEKANADMLSAMSSKLPGTLLAFWKTYGLGLWLGGKFQFSDPLRYAPIVKTVLSGDAELDPMQTHVYGYSAFGELYLWSETHQDLAVSLPNLEAMASFTDADWTPSDPDIAIIPALAGLDQEGDADWIEDAPEASFMFKRTRKKLGELTLGEVYGFVPALEFGGVARLENVRRVSALEHFSFLAQLGPVQLFDYSTGDKRFVRNLGAG